MFTDVSLPDFEALRIMKDHRKLALGVVGSALGIAAITIAVSIVMI